MSDHNKQELLQLAYENGYNYYEWTSINPDEYHRDTLLSGSGKHSWKNTVWELEDRLNVGEYDDWDQMGVYHIFEDSSVAYEKGAKDALENEDFAPDSINFLV